MCIYTLVERIPFELRMYILEKFGNGKSYNIYSRILIIIIKYQVSRYICGIYSCYLGYKAITSVI